MPNILTPLSLWESFSPSLSTDSSVISSEEEDGIVFERVNFSGRDTGEGRVLIAASYAYDKKTPAEETVIIFPDSKDTINKGLLKLFVEHGYTALMVDYRGEWEGCDFYTHYPENIGYANFAKSGRRYEYVDDSAVETSWYEWVALGVYAKKYAVERSGKDEIAVVGLRDGGEIAWKLGVAEKFECIIPVCAAGWRAYSGISKYVSIEPDLNEERYRFIAGIDSQAYAPYVSCPVLLLCSTNDSRFDYDRAYDTFSRINTQFASDSAIAYSVQCNSCIGIKCTSDMFMFLDKYLKNRQVFIPKPAEISVEVDDESNLIAKTIFDNQGIVESCKMYVAEDCIESYLREWSACQPKKKITPEEQDFYLDIYEKTGTVFVLCYVKYINGFTVWSKIVAKKISGKFRNMQSKCRVMYSDKDGMGSFAVDDPYKCAVGGMFLINENALPKLVEKTEGVYGLYSRYGLKTFRMNNPMYSPDVGNILKLDIFCDNSASVTISFFDANAKEEYIYLCDIVGGVWQSIIAESKLFKNSNGTPLTAFASNFIFAVKSDDSFAVNNVMWL